MGGVPLVLHDNKVFTPNGNAVICGLNHTDYVVQSGNDQGTTVLPYYNGLGDLMIREARERLGL
eukprot:NODE_3704_length_413_cov_98.576923_g3268_i0.p3 GENE.NODE_3704_length_413_cov_98.576923_g3268_i0~~NODE_3704_length_413_cov_98.576923_g3268_i0.p3  ORF type:complete len:71 (+),score=37.27 NODE_3704_length_413_cov_98.576923_g3268_i0:24-215(+)